MGFMVTVLACVGVGCGGGSREPSVPPPDASAEPTSRPGPCPERSPDCLVWDDFERADGPVSTTTTGKAWEVHGLSCTGCGPSFEIRSGRGTMEPASEHNSIWLATVDSGRSVALEVSSRIRLSPTPERANVGLVALFVDPQNHLVCKIEVSEGHPTGLIALGDEVEGVQDSLLDYRKDIGLRNGSTYRLTMEIPRRLERRPVRCEVFGPKLGRWAVSYRLSADRIDAYGSGTGQGLRIKIFEDEDDGMSAWEDFLVRPI
jgi:hypothetical protein